MSRYYVIIQSGGAIWTRAASAHEAQRIADELNRHAGKAVFGFKTEYVF